MRYISGLIGAFALGLGAPASAAALASAELSPTTCVLTVQVPPSESIYNQFGSDRWAHAVCPFEWRRDRVATLIVFRSLARCQSSNVFGAHVTNREFVSDKDGVRRYLDCLNGARSHRATPMVTFMWHVPQNVDVAELHHIMMNKIAASGTYIAKLNVENQTFCFEMMDKRDYSPSRLFEGLGMRLPGGLIEKKFPGETCDNVSPLVKKMNSNSVPSQ